MQVAGAELTLLHILETLHAVSTAITNRPAAPPGDDQLTADACGLPVVAGPAEAAALGNVLVQARALGAGPDDLDGMRALIRATQPMRRFEPAGDTHAWAAAARRL